MAEFELWTVSKCGMNFGISRREINRILEECEVKPVKAEGRKKLYKVHDVFQALAYGSEKLSLTQESAKHKMELARKAKRENDLEEGLLAPIEDIREALAAVASQICPILESLLPQLKNKIPQLTARDCEFIEKEIARCKNSVADIKGD
jgi:phage terminase Nu1 subunit (DNA packaging protein)